MICAVKEGLVDRSITESIPRSLRETIGRHRMRIHRYSIFLAGILAMYSLGVLVSLPDSLSGYFPFIEGLYGSGQIDYNNYVHASWSPGAGFYPLILAAAILALRLLRILHASLFPPVEAGDR